jgi:arylsulfatase A-like enzyme
MDGFSNSLLAGKQRKDRPNILFIMSDDHAAPAISAYGVFLADVAPTPNIDRPASQCKRWEANADKTAVGAV